MLEFDIKRKPADVVNAIVAQKPIMVGFGVYIWNLTSLKLVVAELKRDYPEITIALGGPEVRFEADMPDLCESADYLVVGEADVAFPELCWKILAGDRPPEKIIRAKLPNVDRLILPYDLYDENDIAHRITCVESSRGCPFECEYCVSANDAPVRYFALPRLFEAFERLLDRGARHFKFMDRAFNANIDHAVQVMEFFLARMRPDLFLHFEMMPDRFPDKLRSVIAHFPTGVMHLEIGIQTYNEEVARRIKRRQKMASIDETMRFLKNETGSLIHADLIAGLPGESMESFAAGFDRLVALRPHELQVGILKRLRGTPIGRHDEKWGMVYAANPPYEILENKLIDRESMDRIKRFARYWELIANRGNFEETLSRIIDNNPFRNFMKLSDWLFGKTGRDFGIALRDLVELLFTYLTMERKLDRQTVAQTILRDYQRKKRRETPSFLKKQED
jgi:radical SAM superfamily enzyme YgiQ (UPF0313 family)